MFKNAKDETIANYYANNHFGDGCTYIEFVNSDSNGKTYVQNYNVGQGIKGTSGKPKLINAVRNNPFETRIIINGSKTDYVQDKVTN